MIAHNTINQQIIVIIFVDMLLLGIDISDCLVSIKQN
jgi:hypothetical protein